MAVRNYRKRPVTIQAMQFLDDINDYSTAQAWCPTLMREVRNSRWRYFIDTLEGIMEVSPGDWIIKGVEGEFYPCKPGIFAATYEEAAME